MTWVRDTEVEQKTLDQRAGPFQVPGTAQILIPITNQLQELENVFWALFDSRFLDNATGYQLELLGVIVGEPPAGETDEVYKQRIRLKLAAINSSRTEDAFRGMLGLLPDTEWFVSSSPGYINITQVSGSVTVDSSMIFRMAKIASADGVLAHVTTFEDSTSNFFEWPSQDGSITGGEWASQDGAISGDAWPGVRSQ